MSQEIKINAKEIMEKLAKLQADVEYLKANMITENPELKAEMEAWEKAGEEDLLNWEKEHLR